MDTKNLNEKENLTSGAASYTSPTPGEITIMAISPWAEGMIVNGSQKDTEPPTLSQFATVKECGFNAVRIESSVNENVLKAFMYANYYGLVGVWCRNVYKITTLSAAVNQIQSVLAESIPIPGFEIADEPEFSSVQPGQVNYEIYNGLKKNFPDKLQFFNFAPSTATKYIGDNPDYYSYLQYIQNLYAPSLWSYDFYPIETVPPSTDPTVYTDFYTYLELYRKISTETGKPFWAYCLCTQILNTANMKVRPEPTIPYLRFEAFMALAYGAQGIVFWHYANRLPNGAETYQLSPIMVSSDGTTVSIERTQIWYNVQQVISEIKQYNSVFYGCTVQKIYNENSSFSPSNLPITNVSVSGAGVILSHLTNNTNNYIVIVNKDPFNTQEIEITVNNVSPAYLNFKLISDNPLPGRIENSVKNYVSNLKLGPGDYLIYQWGIV